jgi:hypothetical protein
MRGAGRPRIDADVREPHSSLRREGPCPWWC